MKIAIFTDTFLPQVNGVVTATISLAKNLADRGHKIYIICPKFNGTSYFKHKNIQIIRMGSIPAYFYEDFRFTAPVSFKLFNFLKKEKIDIIHFQTQMPLGIQAIILSKLLKIPLIGTFHTNIADPDYLKHIKLNNKYVQNISWIYNRFYYNRCDLITCPSEVTREELLKSGFKEPIKAISNGINLNIFNNSNWKQVKKKYNKKGKILLFVGRIAHEKNIFYLLDCFKLILKKVPNTKLLVVGDGPQMTQLKQKIKDLKVSNNIILTGRIAHEKLIKSSIFKISDLFVTASTTETQGISTLEAQANGLVCVGINKGGIKNLIKDNYNGFLVERNNKKKFADRIIQILTDKNLYKKMRINTLKEIKKHDISKITGIWEKEYTKLIKKYNPINKQSNLL